MNINNLAMSGRSSQIKIEPQTLNIKNQQKIKNNEKASTESSVSGKEAAILFIQGAVTHLKNTALSIIQHPIKVASSIALTSAGIAILPLFGISMTVGISTLSLGFAILSSINLAKDILKTAKDFNNKNYDNLRKDIKNAGADSLDVMLSAPFAGGAVKTINRQVKYGKITLNKPLFESIKTAKSFNNMIINLMKEQYNLTYNQIIKERGIKTPPPLQFVHLNKNMSAIGGWNNSAATISIYENNLPFNLKNFGDIKERANVIYVPYLKECLSKIRINNLSPIIEIGKTCKDFLKMTSKKFNLSMIDNALSHELTHMDQYLTIARTEGIGIEAIKPMNTKFYKAAINTLGTIKKNSKEAEQAVKYLEAKKNYISVNPKDFKHYLDSYPKYRANLLEKEAFKTGDDYVRFKPKTIINYANEMTLIADEKN